MVKKNQSGANSAQNADLSVENLQETEKGNTFALRPARTEEEMLRRKEGDRKYVNPMSDYGFKAVFGLENVMKTFLNDLLLPTSPIVQITFLDKEMLPQNDEERGVVYDLRCKTEDGTEFIVEMQNQSQKYFSDRIVFYLSRTIAPQGIKGTENGQQWDYKLEPVYGVFFLNFHLDIWNRRCFERFNSRSKRRKRSSVTRSVLILSSCLASRIKPRRTARQT